MHTIATALELVRAQLNAALQSASPRGDDWVILSNLVGQDGRALEATRNKVVMTLAHIAPDPALRNAWDAQPGPAVRTLPISLLVAFVANFENDRYTEGLAAISRTIRVFDETPVLTNNDLPGPPLTLAMPVFDLSDVNAVCRRLGVMYHPAVFYSLRNVVA